MALTEDHPRYNQRTRSTDTAETVKQLVKWIVGGLFLLLMTVGGFLMTHLYTTVDENTRLIVQVERKSDIMQTMVDAMRIQVKDNENRVRDLELKELAYSSWRKNVDLQLKHLERR